LNKPHPCQFWCRDTPKTRTMYPLLKKLLFLMPPERAHYFSMDTVNLLMKIPGMAWAFRSLFSPAAPDYEREFFGLKFRNPIGLAAGFDKDARYFEALANLGFGFIEIGTVTPKPQAGNPQPRLFRLVDDQAVINRMGFNNQGVDAAVKRLKKRKTEVVIGGNIGKNKITPNEQATDDYLKCFEALYPWVDYFTVNVSSPNTPNLRELQGKAPLKKLLHAVMARNAAQPKQKPVFLKIAPDLNEPQLDDIIEIVEATGIQGVIATNTTIERQPLQMDAEQVSAIGAGGLSGQPLGQRATDVIRYLYEKSGKKLFIIGVGGIATAKDAREKLAAGAQLLQVYTGFIYEGPAMVKKIVQGL